MLPVLIELGDFQVYSYGTAIVLAALIGGWLAWRLRPPKLFSLDQYLSICLLTTLGAMLGARLAALWMAPQPLPLGTVFRLWEPVSLASIGVPVVVLPVVTLYCHYQRLSTVAVLDHLFPFALFGAAFQRAFGCFLAGCCGGPPGLQVIEGASLFVLFLVLRRLGRTPRGALSIASLGAYASVQCLIRPWRLDGGGPWVLAFYATLALSCGAALLYRSRTLRQVRRQAMRKTSAALYIVILSLPLTVLGASSPASPSPESDEQLGRAINAYLDSAYEEAHALLRPLADAGRSEAQYLLGSIYEQGLGVSADPVEALAWYLRASRLSHRRAEQAMADLRLRLSPEQEKKAEILAREERIGLDREHGCMSFFGEAFPSHYVSLFPPGSRVDAMVEEILGFTGLEKNFRVHAANVANAAAVIEGSTRYLLYNPRFIDAVNQRAGTPWAVYSVMAHEIGHHLQGHTIQPGGSRPQIEIQADEYSGFILAQMGADLKEAQSAIAAISTPIASLTHPARRERLQAIREGWSKARQKIGSQLSRRQPGLTSSPLARSIPALRCATPKGECPIPFPVTSGSVCYCQTSAGPVAGYGRW